MGPRVAKAACTSYTRACGRSGSKRRAATNCGGQSAGVRQLEEAFAGNGTVSGLFLAGGVSGACKVRPAWGRYEEIWGAAKASDASHWRGREAGFQPPPNQLHNKQSERPHQPVILYPHRTAVGLCVCLQAVVLWLRRSLLSPSSRSLPPTPIASACTALTLITAAAPSPLRPALSLAILTASTL